MQNRTFVIAKLNYISNSKFFTTSGTTQHCEYIHERVLLTLQAMIMIWLNWCINYISGQTTDLDHRSACSFPFLTVLSILTAVSSPTVVYPKVVLTVVFIPTVVYILTVVSSLCDYSSQHSPHSLAISFHVIFISAYPAVQVKLYAYYAKQKWFITN